MKVVILAGGLGSRLSEETTLQPKPMVEIGGLPILWHILKGYSHHGFKDFVIALGYKGEFIKDYFLHYLEAVGGANDIDLWNRISEHGHLILVQPEHLMEYRVHSVAISSGKSLE